MTQGRTSIVQHGCAGAAGRANIDGLSLEAKREAGIRGAGWIKSEVHI
jgi:hypothetical protein